MDSARLLAPAKVNLRLVILSRQTTGYHNLETILSAISLADLLQVWPAKGLEFESLDNGISTGPPEENLVVRAARAFYTRSGIEPSARIRLEKRIPSAAGLGGGSSDAAATLRLLNALHDRPLPRSDLLDCAATLGSDVPFFLTRTPFALAWGRGERLLSLRPPPVRDVLLVQTGVDVPTGWAFERLGASREKTNTRTAGGIGFASPELRSWNRLAKRASNDFEDVVAERIPALAGVKAALREENAIISLLSGSGGAVFGIFPSPADAGRAQSAIEHTGLECWRGQTLRQWPSVERLQHS